MADFAPITLSVVDQNGKELVKYSVPFVPSMTARQVLEEAFVQGQTSAKPDPFVYTLEYYGYSEFADYPGYLGYEIETIQDLANDQTYFWELKLNGQVSKNGADTTFPPPGAKVVWEYTSIAASQSATSGRAKAVLIRRGDRQSEAD